MRLSLEEGKRYSDIDRRVLKRRRRSSTTASDKSQERVPLGGRLAVHQGKMGDAVEMALGGCVEVRPVGAEAGSRYILRRCR